MSDLWIFCILVLTIDRVLSISYKSPINPDHPHDCWLEKFQMPLPREEVWTDRENCVRYMCFARKMGKFYFSVDECPRSNHATSDCIIGPINHEQDYPECCPDIICD
ncbi:hypothetical protein DMENIID0001_132870 [Sergentomyia squamirostris]